MKCTNHQHADTAVVPGFVKIGDKQRAQYWESEATRPPAFGGSTQAEAQLQEFAKEFLPDCMRHPFKSPNEIRQGQFERIRHLVAMAYHEIPVYTAKYKAVGFEPGDLKSWADFQRLPVITKDELIAATHAGTVSRRWPLEDLYSTRSSGSSGKTLLIKVNQESILVDTLQGIRQMWLQSGLRYGPDDVTAMLYTVPWWFDGVGDAFPSAFISSLIAPGAVGQILDELRPHILSCYPTNLKALIPHWDRFDRSNLYLAVIHSEGSTPAERRAWSRALGIPVLDEYSSEEATRMALELPCGHYHVCEDAVHLEVLHPQTFAPQADGESGLAVVTNLLNEAMPFIRYVQGDLVTRPRVPGACHLGWSQLATLDGRANDSFINLQGREIPAGTVLDVTYRWMFDAGIHIKEFELVQKTPDRIQAVLMVDADVPATKIQASLEHLQALLHVCMDHPIQVEAEMPQSFPKRLGKRRPIRRDFPHKPVPEPHACLACSQSA
jgi:phenylacetate-CoA ligase